MGLFDKTNPKATLASVAVWAIGGAMGGPILLTFNFWLKGWSWSASYWLPILLAAVAGAASGALVEWQLDDSDEEDAKPDPMEAGGVWDRELDVESLP
jgi:hypothetical protein